MDKREPKKLQVHGKFGRVMSVNGVVPDENGNVEIPDVDVTGATVGQMIVVKAVAENGKPTEWEAMSMPEIPEQEQADWNQNDSTAPDYIENRTHYDATQVLFTTALNRLSGYTYESKDATVISAYTQVVSRYGGRTLTVDIGGAKAVCTTKILNEGKKTAQYYLNTESGKMVAVGYPKNNFMRFYADAVGIAESDLSETVAVQVKIEDLKPLDEKFIPDSIARTVDIPGTINEAMKPLLLNVDDADTYLADSIYGNAALEAIKAGRQILVRVPNASGDNYVASYSPVYMYQLPNHQNKYLYLFFLRDEKQDLSALLGQPAGTVLMPTYGQLKMLLPQEYNSNPLES